MREIKMGWSNYIVIPKWKLLIEVSRDVNDLADYERAAIDKIIDDENLDYDTHFDGEDVVEMGNVQINQVTIRDFAELYKRHDIVQSLAGMDYNKLFLYWLKRRSIDFSVQSEHSLDVKKYINEGYTKIER
jgi:hypothetical protein